MPSQCPNDCKESEQMVELLINKGANVNAVDRDDRTALDAAFEANKREGKLKKLFQPVKRMEIFGKFFLSHLRL